MRATRDNPKAFRETLGIEVVKVAQMNLLHRPSAMKGDLFRLLDAMPETLRLEVQTFAEFLQHRQQQATQPLNHLRLDNSPRVVAIGHLMGDNECSFFGSRTLNHFFPSTIPVLD